MRKMKEILLALLLLPALVYAEEDRAQGISVHAKPKRIAEMMGTPWGFEVSYAPYLKEEPGVPYLQSVQEVLAYIKKQDNNVISNGLWVVTTHPSSYSKEEIELQEQVKEELPKHGIPLFWARGSEVSNGFKRY